MARRIVFKVGTKMTSAFCAFKEDCTRKNIAPVMKPVIEEIGNNE